MTKIFIFDVEADSLDTTQAKALELAGALYETSFLPNDYRLVSCFSHVLNWGDNLPKISSNIESLTGITEALVKRSTITPYNAFKLFKTYCDQADHIGGQNVLYYDMPLLNQNMNLFCDAALPKDWLLNKPMIDTFYDIDFPDTITVRGLKYLALDHGYILNGAHQAINDVFATAHIMFQYNIEKMIESTKSQVVTLRAYLKWEDTKRREIIKTLKFHWNPEDKCWEKRVRHHHKGHFEKLLDFPLNVKEYQNNQIGFNI